MKYDMVIVIYEAELDLVLLQAETIAKFIDTSSLNRILYCINDEDQKNTKIFLENNVFNIFDRAGIQFSMYYRDHFTLKKGNGYCLQQIQKIESAFRVETDFYIVIDAKNFLVKRLNLNELFIERSPKIFLESYEENSFRRYMKGMYLSYWSVSEPYEEIKLPAMSTPFVFETNLVKEMIKNIEIKEGMPFGNFFEERFGSNGGYSEFLLYSSYLYMRNKSSICQHSLSLTSWGDDRITSDEINTMIDAVKKDLDWKMCGIHKHRLGSDPHDVLMEIRNIIGLAR